MKLTIPASKALSLMAIFAAAIFMAAPTASAATIIYCPDADGTICQLADVAIDSANYNVTFSSTPDFTFESDPVDALDAIVSTLNSLSCPYCFVGDNNPNDDTAPFNSQVDYIFVAGPDSSSFEYAETQPDSTLPWGASGANLCAECGNPYQSNYSDNGPYIYANFSAASSAPEPGNLAMMLGGVAILALLERKRRSHQYSSIAHTR